MSKRVTSPLRCHNGIAFRDVPKWHLEKSVIEMTSPKEQQHSLKWPLQKRNSTLCWREVIEMRCHYVDQMTPLLKCHNDMSLAKSAVTLFDMSFQRVLSNKGMLLRWLKDVAKVSLLLDVIDETNAALTFEKSSRNIISKSAGKQGHAVKISHRSALQSFPIAGACVLQCVAVCCSVLQCVAVCCNARFCTSQHYSPFLLST